MVPPRGAFGSAIQNARLAKGHTQEKLAELLEISPGHVKQLESERRNPSFAVLYKLFYILDLSFDSLFTDSDDEMQELRDKIIVKLSRCNAHELQVTYATLSALQENEEDS